MSDQPIIRTPNNPSSLISVKFLNANGNGFAETIQTAPGTTAQAFLTQHTSQGDSFRQYQIVVRPRSGEAFTPEANYVLQDGDYLTATFQGQKGA